MRNFPVLLFQFCKPLWLYNILFTAISIADIARNGLAVLLITVIFKMVGYAGAAGYQTYFSSYIYYYYRNAGCSVRKMYTFAFGIDFLLFIVLIVVCLSILRLLHA